MISKIPRGYFGIGIYSAKTEVNMSNLARSALAFDADFMYVVGARYKHRKADTCKAPKHLPLYEYENFDEFHKNLPWKCELVSIECLDGIGIKSYPLDNYVHPERACYLLGAEDFGIPTEYLVKSHSIVHINTKVCLNVATAGAIIMYDRTAKH